MRGEEGAREGAQRLSSFKTGEGWVCYHSVILIFMDKFIFFLTICSKSTLVCLKELKS